MIYNGWDGRIPGIDYPADASDYVWQPPRKTVAQIMREAQERLAASDIWAPIDWAKHPSLCISDTGDETSPSESNPVPIEEIYTKPEETIEERNERMMKLLREFAQS